MNTTTSSLNTTPIVDGFNMDKDGKTARAIKAQYAKNSAANFIRQNSYGATAVIEITPPRTRFLNTTRDGLCPSLTAHYAKANAKNLIEYDNGHRDIAVIEYE